MRGLCVVLVLAVLLPVEASALTVDELDIGEHLRGPHLSIKDFTGKVVLVDLWGVECGPCIAQMPALQELYRKYRPAGFHIVALERQAKSRPVVDAFFTRNLMFKNNALDFDFTYAYAIPIPGRHILNLPANFLFHPDGHLIGANLHADALELKIQEALVDAYADIIPPGEIVALADLETKIKSGENMMVALSELVRRKREATDPKVVEEANRLFSAVFAWANKKYDRAMSQREHDPVEALARMKAIVRQLKGTEIADKAEKAIEELNKDENVLKAQRAELELRAVLTQISDLKPVGNGRRDPEDAEFRRANSAPLRIMATDCQRILNMYPGTAAAEHAKTLAEEYHLRELAP